MRKKGGFFFAIAAIVLSIIIWGNPLSALITALSPAVPATTASSSQSGSSSSSLAISTVNLTVDEARLMAHVTALAQPRATQMQKEVARRYIVDQLAGYGITAESQQYGVESERSTGVGRGLNLVVNFPGRDPTAGSIVLGAHYDTVADSPGADDNGSAIATLLETARIFSAPDQLAGGATKGLKLVFFDQEERQVDDSGLLGSLAFSRDERNMADVQGAVLLDMVGYACHTAGCQTYPSGLPIPNLPETGDFLVVVGLSNHTDLINAFMASAQKVLPTVLSLPIPAPTLRLFPDLLRSDHAPFWDKGIPAVLVTDTANLRNPNYHTPQDTADTLDPAFLGGSAQHVVNAIAALVD